MSTLQQHASVIKLADIDQEQQHLLAPKTFPRGSLIFSYTTGSSSEQEQHLTPFELFREPLLVLGVADGLSHEEEDRRQELGEATEYLRERHPRIVHRDLLLLKEADDEEATSPDSASAVEGPDSDAAVHFRAAMREVAGRFLLELTTYTKAMQASPSIQTPGNTARKTVSLRGDERRPGSGYATPVQSTEASSPTGDNSSRPPSRGFGSPPPATSFDQMQGASNVPSALARSDSNHSKNGNRGSSQDRMSVHGFGSGTSQEKIKNRGKARVGIVTGHIYMMAGQWSEALRMLVEHTNVARKLSDNLWHAKGLEGILVSMLLLAWAGLEFQIPSVCYPVAERSNSAHVSKLSVNLPTDFRPAEVAYQAAVGRLSTSLPDLLKQILSLYRSVEGSLELPALMLCEVRVRFCGLMTTLHHENGELNGNARIHVVERSWPRDSAKSSGSNTSNSLSRTTIATMLAEAQPTEEDNIAAADHIRILAGISSVYGDLSMGRKQGLVLKDMVNRLTAALNQARKVGAAEAGIHPAASLSADTGIDSVHAIATDSAGINDVIDEIAEIYGIDLFPSAESEDQLYDARKLSLSSRSFGNDMLQSAIMQALLAFCEAAPDLKGVLRLAASLLQSGAAYTLSGSGQRTSGSNISRDDQVRLATIISRTVGVSKHLGLPDLLAKYWDPFLVRGITFDAPNVARALSLRSQNGAAVKASEQSKPGNPLLYDPNASSRAGAAAQARILFVRNESRRCHITLRNPLEISVEIESISLVTEGDELVELKTKGFKRTALAALCFQQVSFSVSPLSVGDFAITGCRVKIAGCREQFFPVATSPSVPTDELPVKRQGQGESESGIPDTAADGKPIAGSRIQPVTMEATSIRSMPLLEVQSVSLADSSMMLLEGEKRDLSVVVRNTSSFTAAGVVGMGALLDVLSFKSAGSGVSNPDYRTKEGVEPNRGANEESGDTAELDRLEQQDPEALAIIQPGEAVTLLIEAFGKAGVSDLNFDITYRPSPIRAGDAYARVLSMPLHLTVEAALKAENVNIVDVAGRDAFELSFDLRNACPKAIAYAIEVRRQTESTELLPRPEAEAELERVHQSEDEVMLGPGEVRRVALSMERTAPPRTEASATQDNTSTFERLQEDLLMRVRLPWRTCSGEARCGATDLRGLRLTTQQVEVTRAQPTRVSLEVVGDSRVPVKVGSFVTVRVRLVNASATKLSPSLLQLQSPADDRRLNVVGALHRMLKPLGSGSEIYEDFVLCPLVAGLLELGATVTPVLASKGQEWHTRCPLTLRVC